MGSGGVVRLLLSHRSCGGMGLLSDSWHSNGSGRSNNRCNDNRFREKRNGLNNGLSDRLEMSKRKLVMNDGLENMSGHDLRKSGLNNDAHWLSSQRLNNDGSIGDLDGSGVEGEGKGLELDIVLFEGLLS